MNKMTLWYMKKFKKEQLVKLVIFGDNKHVTTHYVKYKDDTIKLPNREEAYKLEPEKIYFQNGFATLIYYEDEPLAFDIRVGTNESEISAKDLYSGLEQQIVKKIIAGAKGDEGFKNILLFGSIALIGIMGIGFYYLYDQITVINETLQGYETIMEALRQSLLNGSDTGGLGGFE